MYSYELCDRCFNIFIVVFWMKIANKLSLRDFVIMLRHKIVFFFNSETLVVDQMSE